MYYNSKFANTMHFKEINFTIYQWDENSTYIREPPFFIDFPLEAPPLNDIIDSRVLALLGVSVTTDHISPAGAIPKDMPAGKYLISKGIKVARTFKSAP